VKVAEPTPNPLMRLKEGSGLGIGSLRKS